MLDEGFDNERDALGIRQERGGGLLHFLGEEHERNEIERWKDTLLEAYERRIRTTNQSSATRLGHFRINLPFSVHIIFFDKFPSLYVNAGFSRSRRHTFETVFKFSNTIYWIYWKEKLKAST